MADVEDSFTRANAEIEALKKLKPATAAEARRRTAELVAKNEALVAAAKQVTAASAQKRVTNGSGARPAGGKHFVTAPQLNAVIDIVAKAVGEDRLRTDALEKRIAELEARPMLQYQGTWDAHKVYNVGSFVTDDGSLWHCEDANIGVRPGSSEAWRLAVKRGRDGKGSR